MNEKMDLVVFRINKRLYGIDSSEIRQVTDRPGGNEGKNNICADELFGIKGTQQYAAEIHISAGPDRQYILKVPVLEDMITVSESDLLPVPDLIKERQVPFVLWGFTESEGKLLSLVTFEYFR